MFSKNLYNNLSRVLLSAIILNLIAWNLFLVPMQTQAGTTRYSCNPETGKCEQDDDGEYTCYTKCSQACSGEVPDTSSGPIDVYIVGPTPCNLPVDPSNFLNTISTFYEGTEMAEITKQELIDIIQKNETIPESLKPYVISSIQKSSNIPENTKNLLIDAIQKNGKIPEDLKSLAISAINGNADISGLIKNWLLDLLLKHVDIEHICKSLSDIVANIMVMGTTIGTPVAFFITQMCPIILNELLQAFLQTLPEPPAPENTQVIQYPIFESYQWEIGIPGFTRPGEITPFK